MTSFLFVTWDGGGNVPPAVAIAAELHQRGHRVRVLGHPQQRRAIESSGLHFEPYRSARAWSSTTPTTTPQWAWKYLRLFTDRTGITEVTDSIQRTPTDVAVVDCMMLGAIKGAQDAGIRQVTLTHTLYTYLDRRLNKGPIGLVGRIKGLSPSRLWGRSDLNLVVGLADLETTGRLPSNARFTGPIWPTGAPVPAPHDGQQDAILVSLSSIFYVGQTKTLNSIMDAVAGLPHRVVLTTGHGVDPADLRAPGNVEVHRFLPHGQILPQVRLVVGHAGHSTTMQAFAHDLPLILIPMSPLADQPLLAKAVARLGAARVLKRSPSPAAIKAAIVAMLDDGPHRVAAAAIGARLRAAHGLTAAADLLEHVGSPASLHATDSAANSTTTA